MYTLIKNKNLLILFRFFFYSLDKAIVKRMQKSSKLNLESK